MEVPDPGAAIEGGLKVTVRLLPTPGAVREIAPLKPPETAVVMVAAPDAFLATVIDAGEAETVKAGDTADATVSCRVAVWVIPPPVPVMVTV